jgi:hypothetical protein
MGLLKNLKIRAQKPAVERPSPFPPPPTSQLIRMGYFISRRLNRYYFLFLGVFPRSWLPKKVYSIIGKKENEKNVILFFNVVVEKNDRNILPVLRIH